MPAAALDAKGLKRICANCGTRFYDLNKRPIICPACETEFTGETKVRTRRSRAAANDAAEEAKAVPESESDENEIKNDEETISLEEVEEGNEDGNEEDLDLAGDLENLDDIDNMNDDMDDDDDDLDINTSMEDDD